MARVLLKYQLNVSFMETSGKTVNRIYEAPVASYADLDAFAVAVNAALTGFLSLMSPLTESVISSYTISGVYVEDALVLPADAENQDQALLSAKIVGDPTSSAVLSIPAPVDAMFVSPTGAGHDVVDTSYAPLLIWLQSFTTAGEWTVSDGEQIVISTLKGHRRSVKSGV